MSPEQVVVTVLDTNELRVLVDVPESQVMEVEPGMSVVVVPTAQPGTKLDGKISSVSPIAHSADQFAAEVELEIPEEATLRPTMTCNVRLPSESESEEEE